MSKRIKRALTALLCALALAAALLPSAHAPASAQVAAKPAVNSKAASVAAATEEVLRETSEIRQLAILRPVKSGAQSRAEIERMLLKNLDEETKPEEIRANELTLKKLGLIPADFQLRPFLVSVLTEQILGYYDPKSQTFYLADWIDLDGQQPVISHELTHALQDQHFDLKRFDHWKRGDADAELAAHALVEGDATWEMTLYVLKDARRALAMLKSVGSAQTTKIDAAPQSLRASLLFPYEQGMNWARQLYQRGGWKAVDEAFTSLPQSTEQIIHPEKYFAHEAPARVDLPDLAPALGRGWRRIDYDVNGEWGYYLILNEFLKNDDESRRAAAGWGGDRYALYENARTHETTLAQLSAWDTEQDAREFYDAYVKRTERRYGIRGSNQSTVGDDSAVNMFMTTDKSVAVVRRGSRVIVVEGAPQNIRLTTLLGKIWQ
ncbi:MAG: hypothetical protein ABR563_09320 [Pyrinomonadaceae bacterium]